MLKANEVALCWLRRDLRLEDQTALYYALKSGLPVLPIFIFDDHILDKLSNKRDARVAFLHATLSDIKQGLNKVGADLLVRKGRPEEVWKQLLTEYNIKKVFYNRDYEPYALSRDQQVDQLLNAHQVEVFSFKDQVIFEPNEVVKEDGNPYVVYTPYSKLWKQRFNEQLPVVLHIDIENGNWFKAAGTVMPSLGDIGFLPSQTIFPPREVSRQVIKTYEQNRDFPARPGTSRLGLHYRFGTISIREKALSALSLSEKYLNELIWREFYQQILYHFPHVTEGAFKPAYNRIKWRNNEQEFELWKQGKTGYPIVDAGMRELATTGYMHNRVRMIVASFLTKHLLIDWRWGEAWFAEKLLDFDLASNNGGWQWAAGSGVDAAPYFRVFNPALQTEKFDPQFTYIKQWVKEWNTGAYPKPMVDHKMARLRCLEAYKEALGSQG